MRNLLSQQYKKKILTEYKLRISIVIVVFMFFTILIASGLLLPSYIVSDYRYNIAQMNAKIIKNSIEKRGQDEPISVLVDTQEKLELLTESKDETILSDVFEKIINKRSTGTKIQGLVYNIKNNGIGEIVIAGTADNRESLLRFKKDLEKESAFSEVVLPVSDLASDADIDFSIRIAGKF